MIKILIGHGKSQNGGYDPGACSRGYEEFQIARYIGKYASEMIVDSELVNFYGNLSLIERIAKYKNDDQTDLIVEIHLNAGGGTGCEAYYYDGDDIGKQYATTICEHISDAFSIKNRGAKPGKTFGIIRETKPRALLVECCFIDSSDLDLVKTSDGQKKMGQAIANALSNKIYRVQVGAFKNKENAEKYCQELRNKGFKDAFIV